MMSQILDHFADDFLLVKHRTSFGHQPDVVEAPDFHPGADSTASSLRFAVKCLFVKNYDQQKHNAKKKCNYFAVLKVLILLVKCSKIISIKYKLSFSGYSLKVPNDTIAIEHLKVIFE